MKKIKFIATDGFQFSGSGLINDFLISSGAYCPSDIRMDELLNHNNNFSWQFAINNKYSFNKKLNVFLKLVFIILKRIPINFFQRTFLYKLYLKKRGRINLLNEPNSVNRSIKSYILSIKLLFFIKDYNFSVFKNWFYDKYNIKSIDNKVFILDNGIPYDEKLFDWLDQLGTFFIVVYRDPLIQYCQILDNNLSRGLIVPSYEEFLQNLINQYTQLTSNKCIFDKLLPVSFDLFLNNYSYRLKFTNMISEISMLTNFNYNFEDSVSNNLLLIDKSRFFAISENARLLENSIDHFHNLFLQEYFHKINLKVT